MNELSSSYIFDPVDSRCDETCGLTINEMRERPDLAKIVDDVERRFGRID